MKHFGKKLEELRGVRQLTQQQLGDMAGVSGRMIRRYEAEPTASMRGSTYAAIAHALGMTKDQLDATWLEDASINRNLYGENLLVLNVPRGGEPVDYQDVGVALRETTTGFPTTISDPDTFAVEVVEESMSPDFHRGDVLLCSPSMKFEHGKAYFIEFCDGRSNAISLVFKLDTSTDPGTGDKYLLMDVGPTKKLEIVEGKTIKRLSLVVSKTSRHVTAQVKMGFSLKLSVDDKEVSEEWPGRRAHKDAARRVLPDSPGRKARPDSPGRKNPDAKKP